MPLTLGRMMVRYVLGTQATRISDFLPLSLGVVVLSAVILAVVKLCEALPAISARAASLQNRRWLHLLVCTVSSIALLSVVLVFIPLGLGSLSLRLVLPLKAQSVYQVPIVFMATDCWSLGLVLTKVAWRLVQTDVMLHSLHVEFAATWSEVQGSFTALFFNLHAHRRVWHGLVMPLLEVVIMHLVFPWALTHSLLLCCVPEAHDLLRAALLMYCYHVVLGLRVWTFALPLGRHWLTGVRQRIFDAKYLVSTELQNYHHGDEAVGEAVELGANGAS